MEKDEAVKKPKAVFSKVKSTFGSRNKAIISIIIFVILGVIIWRTFNNGQKQAQYQTVSVSKGTIISTVNESGNVSSSSQAGVGSPTSGVVTKLYVKDGDSVNQGQNLFSVKSIATTQEIASAYSAYLSALSTLDTDKSKLNSLQSALFKANQAFVTDRGINNPSTQQQADPVYIEENANWLQAESDYNNQSAIISKDQAAVNNTYLAYQATQDSVVSAPISGTVANIVIKPGDQVTASGGNLTSTQTSTSSTANNSVLYIGDYSKPYIKLQASEVDITSIKNGQKATIALSAFPGKTFVGNVDQVDSSGTITTGVVTYNVFITFVAPPAGVKPGMSATVNIQTDRKDNVLTVPSSAIQTSGGQSTVRILQNGKINSVPIQTGISSDTDTEVTSGLNEGDVVVTSVLSSGQSSAGGTSPFSGFRGFGGFGGGGGGVRVGGGRGG